MKWLKRGGAILLALLTLAGATAGVGLLMPETHRAVSTLELAVPPETVFARISDVERGADWRPSVERVELLESSGNRQRFREHGSNGPLTMEIVEISTPRSMTTRIADAGLPFGGTWTLLVEPTAGGSKITIEERGEVYNPIFRVVSRFAIGYNATMETYLFDLASSFGEPAAPITSTWSR